LKFSKITEPELIKKAQEQAEHGPQAGAIGWFGDFNAMAMKTVVRKVISWGPMSIELQNAIANDEDIQDAEVIRDEENQAPKQVINASQMMQDADAAEVNEQQSNELEPSPI
jgi:recombinational DNA repair protein RecT